MSRICKKCRRVHLVSVRAKRKRDRGLAQLVACALNVNLHDRIRKALIYGTGEGYVKWDEVKKRARA